MKINLLLILSCVSILIYHYTHSFSIISHPYMIALIFILTIIIGYNLTAMIDKTIKKIKIK